MNESLFNLAKDKYFQALRTQDRLDWAACIYYSREYLRAGGGFGNVHVYLNLALNTLGLVREALESCLLGLSESPDDVHLRHNRPLYEAHLAQEEHRLRLSEGRPSSTESRPS